jgi:hypothetical protein
MEVSKHFPVLLITGPRQVGKTTLLRRLSEKERQYVTLDNPMVRNLAISDPELFLQRYEPPILIDEIQYAPQLLPYIKIYVDEHKNKGAIWLTGSQMFHLMKGVSESLAGRVGIINLYGLTYSEIITADSPLFQMDIIKLKEKASVRPILQLKELYTYIKTGSMPALYADKQDVDTFYASYLQTYLQRDIKDLTQVGDELTFLRFITAAAARTGQLLNYADIARDIGISEPTVKQWISILIASGIVYLLEPYHNNLLKRLVKTPKLYFIDTGLCAYLTRWTSSETLEAGAMSGAFFETWVISEIVKNYNNMGKRPPLYFYRDKDQKEVDLLINENNVLYPIEIKKNANPGNGAIASFKTLEKTKQIIGPGGVICLCSELVPIDRNNWFIPVGLL